MRTLSYRGLKLIKQLEGLRLTPYRDVAGLDTVGYGHRCSPEEVGCYVLGITEPEAESLLEADVAWAEHCVNTYVKRFVCQHMFDALVSFAYNVGPCAFAESQVCEFVNDGDFALVPDEMRRWNKAGGRVIAGLIARRDAEARLFADS